MACPNCDHTMESIHSNLFWCPRCGTLKHSHGVDTPQLVERCREFEMDLLAFAPKVRLDNWNKLGIAEAIHVPAYRPVASKAAS